MAVPSPSLAECLSATRERANDRLPLQLAPLQAYQHPCMSRSY